MFKIFQETKTIKWLNHYQETIDFSPSYQRLGRLWKRDQKQLLADSILNGFDIPKFYFQFMPSISENKSKFYNYAIIDGKQRIEAILGFINDEFPLSDTFVFFNKENHDEIAGKYFSEIEICAPAVAARFWQYELNIVFMDTTEPDMNNEMFIRLNSGITVNTAEKRNATGGKLSNEIQIFCQNSKFFQQKINITNKRFIHHDLALKFLMIEMGEWTLTKNAVDKFVLEQKDFNTNCAMALRRVQQVLSKFEFAFYTKDRLLSKKNIVLTLYAAQDKISLEFLRPFLEQFEEMRETSIQASKQNQECDQTLVEFSRLLQQGSDKKSSIQRRREIMLEQFDTYLNMQS